MCCISISFKYEQNVLLTCGYVLCLILVLWETLKQDEGPIMVILIHKQLRKPPVCLSDGKIIENKKRSQRG